MAVAAATTSEAILRSWATSVSGVTCVCSHPPKPWPVTLLGRYRQLSSFWKYRRILLAPHVLSPVSRAMYSQSLLLGRMVTRALCCEQPPRAPTRGYSTPSLLEPAGGVKPEYQLPSGVRYVILLSRLACVSSS